MTVERDLHLALDVRRRDGAAAPPLPGEEIAVTVTTSDPQGKPVVAEVSLALVEQALLDQFPAALSEIEAVFRGSPRTRAVRTSSSVSFAYRPPTCLAGTAIAAEAPRPQEIVIAKTDEADVADDAEQSIDATDQTTAFPDQCHSPKSLSAARNLPGVSEPETAYWNPAIVTNDQGRATVVIPLPDRLATWKLLAQGITAGTLAGGVSVELTATKDVYAQWKLPTAFTDGDTADVVAVIHNRLLAEQTVELTLATQIGSRTAEERKTVKVAPAGAVEVPFHVQLNAAEHDAGRDAPSETASEAVFQLELTAGQRRDALRRSVPIQSPGMAVSVASGGVADADTVAWIEPPAEMPFHWPRLQIVVGATVERSLLDVVLNDSTPAGGALVETAASDLMAALALQKLFAAAPDAVDPVARELDARIRAALGTLVSAQHEDSGGWSWSARADAADRGVTARVLWVLGLTRQAGYSLPQPVLDNALRCSAGQWAALADDDYDTKAILLYARCVAGERDFEPANGLYRVRTVLSTPALLYLALALVEMERSATAAELLELVAQRKLDDAGPAEQPAGPVRPSHDSPTELRALYALALLAARPEEPKTAELIDWLLAHRMGARWSPERATGPAMLALCRWFGPRPSPAEPYRLAISVNDQAARVVELDSAAPGHTIDVPAAGLVPGKQQVRFELTGRGRWTYQLRLSGFVPADQLKSSAPSWRVERFYAPAPLERDGQPVPRGFACLKRDVQRFRNELRQLAVGRLGEVELRIVRNEAQAVPAEQLECLIVHDPLPAGTFVVPGSVRGSFDWFEQEPGAIIFYVGNRRKIGGLSYALQGFLPGSYRAAPTIVRNAHRPSQIAVAQLHTLTVLPLGAESKDPYRLTPQELLALGGRAFQQSQWQEANSLLTELVTKWEVSDAAYREVIAMLLDVQLELNDAAQTVRYFEIIRDKWPEERIPFAKLLRIGAAYQAIGEHERSFLGYRAVVESLCTAETGVPGFLASQGEFLRSVDVMSRLLREVPPEPYGAAARFGLAQQLAAQAPHAADDPKLKAAGVGRIELLARAGRLTEALLVDHPDDPVADQVAFAAAGGLLERGRYEEAATACERYARRYPDSDLLDSF